MRVVFDTNIYVSAFVLPGSSADRAMQRIFDGHDTLLISKPILDELLTTLARKFSRDADALSRTALLWYPRYICSHATRAPVTELFVIRK